MDDSMDFDQEDLHQFPNLDTNSSTPHPNNKICKRNTSDGSAPPSSWKYSYDQTTVSPTDTQFAPGPSKWTPHLTTSLPKPLLPHTQFYQNLSYNPGVLPLVPLNPHLQSVNLESGLAYPQTLMGVPQETNPKMYPRQQQSSSHAQRRRDTKPKPFKCRIPGCEKRYTRKDTRRKHHREIHGIEIPPKKWGDNWMNRPENYHYIVAATEHQKRMNENDMDSCAEE